MAAGSDSSVSRWSRKPDEQAVAQAEAERRKRQTMLVVIIGLILVVFVGAVCLSLGGKRKAAAAAAAQPPHEAAAAPVEAPPAEVLPEDPEAIRALLSNPDNPVVKITTGKGDMLVELFEDKVPNTAANMIELAEKSYYKGMSFHRVIPGFMAQGGCPNSKQGASGSPGTGGPGYNFADEFDDGLKHTGRGVLSMANAGANTNGSQFFLCFASTPHLDGKHSVFGKVVAGAKVLDALEKIGSQSGQTKETVRFNIEVVLKQDHPYAVRKL